MATLRKVKLYGKLGTKFGRVHEFAVDSAREAVQALCALYPGFREELMTSKDRGYGYAIFLGKRNITKDELTFAPHDDEDIRIAPVPFGNKKGGVLNIIVGVILIVLGYIFPPFGVYSIPAGIGMIAGGVIQLLMPGPKAPKGQDKPEDIPGYSFNGPINTQAQGNPVPLLYGRLTIGSAVISAGITVKDGVYAPTTGAWNGEGNGSGGGGGGGNRPPWATDWT